MVLWEASLACGTSCIVVAPSLNCTRYNYFIIFAHLIHTNEKKICMISAAASREFVAFFYWESHAEIWLKCEPPAHTHTHTGKDLNKTQFLRNSILRRGFLSTVAQSLRGFFFVSSECRIAPCWPIISTRMSCGQFPLLRVVSNV